MLLRILCKSGESRIFKMKNKTRNQIKSSLKYMSSSAGFLNDLFGDCLSEVLTKLKQMNISPWIV